MAKRLNPFSTANPNPRKKITARTFPRAPRGVPYGQRVRKTLYRSGKIFGNPDSSSLTLLFDSDEIVVKERSIDDRKEPGPGISSVRLVGSSEEFWLSSRLSNWRTWPSSRSARISLTSSGVDPLRDCAVFSKSVEVSAKEGGGLDHAARNNVRSKIKTGEMVKRCMCCLFFGMIFLLLLDTLSAAIKAIHDERDSVQCPLEGWKCLGGILKFAVLKVLHIFLLFTPFR
jgi:hypothetical protein